MSETLAGKHAWTGDEPDDASATAPGSESGLELADATTQLTAPLAVPAPAAVPPEQVTCPECGTVSVVALTRRESTDFCPQCDYPLFWTPSKVVLDSASTSAESLRRLPGTAGRVTVGSLPCPHCAEGNLITAEICVRCGGLMDPPEPEPVVVAAPPPAPEPEPAPRTPLWVWVLGGATLLVLIALVSYLVLG